MGLVIIRRGGIVHLSDGDRDVVNLTPAEAEWLSQELRLLVTSEFCLQLHLAACERDDVNLKRYPMR